MQPDTPPPKTPFILMVVLVLVVGILYRFFAPPPETEGWITFHLWLIIATAGVGFGIWAHFFPSYPGCNLFFGPQNEIDQYGNRRKREALCLKNSVGKVKTRCLDDTCSSTVWTYFCRDHDPRSAWMQEWLGKHGIGVHLDTIKALRFANQN